MAAESSDITTTFHAVQREKVSLQVGPRSFLQILLPQHVAGHGRISGQILQSEWMGYADWSKQLDPPVELKALVLCWRRVGHSGIKVLFYKKGDITLRGYKNWWCMLHLILSPLLTLISCLWWQNYSPPKTEGSLNFTSIAQGIADFQVCMLP